MHYHYFQPVATFSQRITASVTILLLEISTIYNTPIFLMHNKMFYCVSYHTFWMEQLNTCTIFNSLPCVTTKFLKKKYTIIFFYKIDGNAWYCVENGTIMYLFLSKCLVKWTIIHLILYRKWLCVEKFPIITWYRAWYRVL